MKEEIMTDALLREFLLGKVNDAERERIENLFLTESQTKERVLALEQDLIEDYLENSLSQEDKERFLTIYSQTEEQRRELRITRSIKDWAVAEARAPQGAAGTISFWGRLWTLLRLKPVFVVPIAVAVVIVVVLAIVWINIQREQRKQLAIEQQLAQLNSPASLREVPPEMISQELRPVTARGVESQGEIELYGENQIVEFALPWIQKERYSTYRAEVSRIGDDKSFTISNVPADNNDEGAIRIRIPAYMLERGHYQIQLSGVASNASLSAPEEYRFAVNK